MQAKFDHADLLNHSIRLQDERTASELLYHPQLPWAVIKGYLRERGAITVSLKN